MNIQKGLILTAQSIRDHVYVDDVSKDHAGIRIVSVVYHRDINPRRQYHCSEHEFVSRFGSWDMPLPVAPRSLTPSP